MSKLVTTQAPDLVVVDFIQNVLPEKNESEYEKLSNGIINLQYNNDSKNVKKRKF